MNTQVRKIQSGKIHLGKYTSENTNWRKQVGEVQGEKYKSENTTRQIQIGKIRIMKMKIGVKFGNYKS